MLKFKSYLKSIWIIYNNLKILPVRKNNSKSDYKFRINYGGARKGNMGGPLVKVSRLQEFFPQTHTKIDLLYCLSNTPYLTERTLLSIKQKNIPIILNQNGVYFAGWYGQGWEKQNKKLIPAYKISDYVFWQSEFCKDSAEEFLGKRSGPGEVLYNAVDLTRFKPTAQIGKRNFTFLVSGKFTKAHFYRIEAAVRSFYFLQKKDKDTNLIIAGLADKEIYKLVLALVNELKINKKIRIIGKYSQANAPAIYNLSDAYVMLKYMDASPNVVAEAMACGLPVIYSATGGVKELVGNDAGIGLGMKQDWSISPVAPNLEKVTEAMRDILSQHEKYSLAARSRAIKLFDLEKWINKHKEVFNRYVKH